ncbi:MAG: tetraacyldisaccharide 4'-kinase [Hyphomonadaceae bacterium]|nr:tetraacyldisaccharide 4'-kinase [Hyphomonadaceae bacterium]
MQPPEFWTGQAEGRDRAPALQAALAPLGALYALGADARRALTRPQRAPAPVVCVGNLTVGGGGKTPIVRALRARLGPDAHVLARGYGGVERGPLRVDAAHSAHDVGDEPLLHARDGVTWIARDRYAGAVSAAEHGARAILLDDGFQNPGLHKDLSLIVIDAGYGIGNRKVFPAGPLRERLSAGLKRADAFIVMGEPSVDLSFLQRTDKPVLHARLEPSLAAPRTPLIAFAGIARPMKFFDTLRKLEADLVDCVPFLDHHPYATDDMDWLRAMALERGARLITTEKDATRLGALGQDILVMPVKAYFDDEAALEALLAPIRAAMAAR